MFWSTATNTLDLFLSLEGLGYLSYAYLLLETNKSPVLWYLHPTEAIHSLAKVTTRYLINDACILGKKTLVSGAAVGINGQVSYYTK